MAKPSYSELLKHPLWQRKRLEILQRDNFCCLNCGSAEKTLHVHHTYYEKGLKPWEYPNKSYRSLCEGCHEEAQDLMTQLHRAIGTIGDSTDELLGYAMGLRVRSDRDVVLDVFNYEVACGLAAAWDLTPERVIGALVEGQIDGHRLREIWEEGRG